MQPEAGGEQVVQAENTAWNQRRAREERVSLAGRQGAGGEQLSSAWPTVHFFTTLETQTPSGM